jgi:hypothetical protein
VSLLPYSSEDIFFALVLGREEGGREVGNGARGYREKMSFPLLLYVLIVLRR